MNKGKRRRKVNKLHHRPSPDEATPDKTSRSGSTRPQVSYKEHSDHG